jgi:hypothetical protein
VVKEVCATVPIAVYQSLRCKPYNTQCQGGDG